MASSQDRQPQEAIEITPAYCCSLYFFAVFGLFLFYFACSALDNGKFCHLELFVNSVSVSNASSNVSAADWTIGFVARSPVTSCKFTLRPIKSRLLLGDQVIDSPYIGQTVVDGDKINYGFETTTMMPEAVNGGVIWDFRFEIVAGVKGRDYRKESGLLMVFCGDIPVKFTTDPAGNVMGSLLGYMKRCDYLFQDKSYLH